MWSAALWHTVTYERQVDLPSLTPGTLHGPALASRGRSIATERAGFAARLNLSWDQGRFCVGVGGHCCRP